jgi:hypothetical protein
VARHQPSLAGVREAGINAPPTWWNQLHADSAQIDVRLSSKANDGDWLNPAKNPELTTWFPLGKAPMDTWDPEDVDVAEATGLLDTSLDGRTFFLGQ